MQYRECKSPNLEGGGDLSVDFHPWFHGGGGVYP
jgi:hypothetical protein